MAFVHSAVWISSARMVSAQKFGYSAWIIAPIRAASEVAALVSPVATNNRPATAWAVVSNDICSGESVLALVGSMTWLPPSKTMSGLSGHSCRHSSEVVLLGL